MAAALMPYAGAAAAGLITFTLAAWLVISIVAQTMPKRTRLRASVLGWAIPEWRFFAPQPATFDYFLFARTRFADGRVGEPLLFDHTLRGRLWPVWHPGGRQQKVLRDMVDALQLGVGEDGRLSDAICLSDAYLSLLGAASAPFDDGSVQFGVLRRELGFDDELVLVSRWHRVAPVPLDDPAQPLEAVC